MGGIGRDLKRKAEALGMRVQYHNRKELDGELAGGAKYVGFNDLLRTSDVISLNLPLNVSLLSSSSSFAISICFSTCFSLFSYRVLFGSQVKSLLCLRRMRFYLGLSYFCHTLQVQLICSLCLLISDLALNPPLNF